MLPVKEYPQNTYIGHVFCAVIHGTNTIVSEFVISDDQSLYTIEAYDSNAIAVRFYHEIKDIEISLLYVKTDLKCYSTVVIEECMCPFKEYPQYTYVGHVFGAVIHGTHMVVSKFVMSDNQRLYTIETEESPNTEC
jgi:hypothetical protein